MDLDKAARLARGLGKNSLLPELLDERSDEIRETWENEGEPEKRERLWHDLKAANDLKDYLYARIDELSGREPSE